VVSEWITEQGSWQEIQEKAVEVATVVIQPTGELLKMVSPLIETNDCMWD
jgi:hypothetical protein